MPPVPEKGGPDVKSRCPLRREHFGRRRDVTSHTGGRVGGKMGWEEDPGGLKKHGENCEKTTGKERCYGEKGSEDRLPQERKKENRHWLWLLRCIETRQGNN